MFDPLVKGLKVAPFVECPNCHILLPLSAKNCSGCSEEIKSGEDQIIYFVALNTGATYQPFTPFVECPNCRKLLRVGIERCPDCYEEVTKEYALGSAAAVVVNTVACDIANTIRGFQAFAVLAVIGSVFIPRRFVYRRGTKALLFCFDLVGDPVDGELALAHQIRPVQRQ